MPLSLDTTALYDIEGPLALSQAFPWGIAVGALGGLLLSVILYRVYYKRKAKGKTMVHRSPYDEALRKLSQLHLGAEADLFASALSDILRAFIQSKLNYPIIYQTTEEFIHTLDTGALQTPIYQDILDFLKYCDLVKFAKAPLTQEKRSALLDTVRKLLDSLHHLPANQEPKL